MLSQIRYQQQYQQLRGLPVAGNLASYAGRDEVTGLRRVETADGGVGVGRYLSNSEPSGVMPLAQFSTIGLTGYISQKPY